jgi:hypothetical protein
LQPNPLQYKCEVTKTAFTEEAAMISRVRGAQQQVSEADLIAWATEVQRLVDHGQASSPECMRLEAELQAYWEQQPEWDAKELQEMAA